MASPSDTVSEREAAPARSLRPVGCSFSPADWEILAQHWFPIAVAANIDEQPQSVMLLDVALVIYRIEGAIKIAQDRCPHRGVPLSMGCVRGSDLICAYHGLHFGPDGRCRKIPAHPAVQPSKRFDLHIFPVVERYGLVWTCLQPGSEEPRIAPFPAWSSAGVRSILLPHVDIAAAAGRQIEGFLDVAHFAWVHRETFADPDNTVVPLYTTRATDYGLQADYWSTVSNYTKEQLHREPPGFRWLRQFDVYPPFAALLTIHFPEEGRLWILNLASPVSARRTRLFVPWARNFDIESPTDDIHAFNAKVFAEDQAIVERQTPADLPLESDLEPHFGADRTSVEYRRLLRKMGLQFRQNT